MMANTDDILTAAANGNGAALVFLRCFARRAHWVDDLHDKDRLPEEGGPTLERLAQREGEWLLTLSSNPFFLAHRAQLVPAMLLALNSWVDSEAVQWDSSDVRAVMKGQWHEVVYLVALLTGGWDSMRKVSGTFREYDLEAAELPKERANGVVR